MTGLLATLVLLGLLVRALWGRRSGGDDDLAGLLGDAETAGFITAEQRARVLALAAERHPAPASGAVWLAVFAGLFVVAGVALLIAHNWASIGPTTRVAAFLALLALVGESAIRTRQRAPGVGISLELVWLLLPLVGIGLYGQTFQLSGDPIRPFLVWLALAAPLAWLSLGSFAPVVHTLALTGVLFTGGFGTDGMLALRAGSAGGGGVLAWTLAAGMLGLIAAQSLRLLPRGHRQHFVGVTAAWTFMLLVAPTPLHVGHAGWLAVAAVAIATVWLLVLARASSSTAERAGAALVWLGTLYALSFAWHANRPWDGPTGGGLLIAGGAVVGALAGAALLRRDHLGPGVTTAWAAAARALVAAPVLVSLLLLTERLALIHLAAVAFNVLLVAIAIALMWHGSLARQVGEINLGILVLLGVLITRFVDVLGSFFQSGIGFIVAGLLLATLAYGLQRTRQRLLHQPLGEAR